MKNIDKYEVLEVLGSGSMGTVYRAHDTVIDRDIALKTIRTGIETEPEMRERFYREARSCGRLQHPNIVTIYDLGEEATTAFIAMELLEGMDFRKLIDEGREIPVTRKLEWMAQICDALGHAHKHGVIHRDVKPSNLFLTEAGPVKVLDFGIARLTSSRLTVAGNILGTPNYMAPEQILANACDGRADLFSAGVVFFELLVYKHPFRGAMIPQRIVEGEPDSLFDHQSNLPPILENVFARALAKNPDNRYNNAAAFAADLRAILAGMRANPSTISSCDLPSNQMEATVPNVPASSVEPALAPEGEDSAEWRNSEVLMLIPQFEKAIEQKDQASAQRCFDSLLRVTVADGRFNEAIESCRLRLEQLGPQLTPPAGSPAQTQRICVECGAGNRSAARFCIGCGANLDEVQAKPVEAVPPGPLSGLSETVFDRTTLYKPDDPGIAPVAPASEVPKQSMAQPAKQGASPVSAKGIMAHRRILIPAAIAIVAIGIVLLGLMFRGYPTEPASATARVSTANLVVHAEESAGSNGLYSLRHGDTVNILKLPEDKSQEWVRVQSVVNTTAKAPGFARLAELSPLAGRDVSSAMKILEVSFPVTPGSPATMERVEALKALAAKYPGTPEASSALAEVEKSNPPGNPNPPANPVPGPDPLTKLHEAQGLVAERKFPEAEAAVREFLAEQPDNLEGQQLLKTVQHSRRLTRLRSAEKLWEDAQYDDAEKIVSRVLEEEPDNDAAKQLLQKIRRWRAIQKP